MKVTVTKYLNVRVGKPSVNAPCYQYLAPGSILDVDGNIYKGDVFDGINTWLKDDSGNYYWVGGLDKDNFKNQLLTKITDKWWLQNFNIPEIRTKGLTGKGVKIAVLDTGISYPHNDLNLDEKLFTDITNSPSSYNDIDGHGTHCVGIIKELNNELGLIGIANEASIYVCKITHDREGDKNYYLIQGIKWAISQNVDIISLSKGTPFEDNKIETALIDANNKGILVIAAAGNKIQGFPSNHIYYPARYKTTISVGGIDENYNPLQDSLLTNETDIFAPGKNILSTYKNNSYLTLSGSSQAAPYVSGVCALLLENERIKNPAFEAKGIKEILLGNANNSSFGKIISLKKILI
jgi:subtilisin family serine protease